MDRPQVAGFECLMGVEYPSTDHPVERATDSDDAREEPARGGVRTHSPPSEHHPEFGPLRTQPYIHGERHGRAGADGWTVNRRYDRLLTGEDSERHHPTAIAGNALRAEGLRAPLQRSADHVEPRVPLREIGAG